MTTKKILITADSSFSNYDLICDTLSSFNDDSKENTNSFYIGKDEDEYTIDNKPIIFVRDRKSDIKIRNLLALKGYRVVQFKSDYEKYKTNAGIKRNETILNHDIESIIIFVGIENDKNIGLEHLQYLAFKGNIPLKVIDDKNTILNCVYNYQEDMNFQEIEEQKQVYLHPKSEEYKKHMVVVTKNIKKMYYQDLNNRKNVKFLNINELPKNKKVLSKSKKKKKFKNEKVGMSCLNMELYE